MSYYFKKVNSLEEGKIKMGLTIKGNYKNSISLDGGYSMLSHIRTEVARLWDEEFGKLYSTLPFIDDYESFDEEANEILESERIKSKNDEDILDFLYTNDCEGKINYKTCKKIYDLLKDTNYKYCLRYAAYSHNDWEEFKQLLKECYSHRASLVWY